MAQSKNIGHGVTFARVTGGPTTIGQVRSITPPSQTRDEVEATDLDDTLKVFLAGSPPDQGQVAITMFWTSGDTNDELLDTDFAANTTASWKIVYPSPITRTATFSAFIVSLTPAEVTSQGVIERTAVFRLTTAITWT